MSGQRDRIGNLISDARQQAEFVTPAERAPVRAVSPPPVPRDLTPAEMIDVLSHRARPAEQTIRRVALNARIPQDLHEAVSIASTVYRVTIQELVERALRDYLSGLVAAEQPAAE